MEDYSKVTAGKVAHGEASSSQMETKGQSAVSPPDDGVDVDNFENMSQDEDKNISDDHFESTELDEEGLCLEYDVVICGTGLVQSILASALARAGKSVLHCDGADYYGELDAVWNLKLIEELLEKKDKGDKGKHDDGIELEHDGNSNGYDTIPLRPGGGRSSFRWHHDYCSSLLSSDVGTYSSGIRVGTGVTTPYGNGIVRSIRHPCHHGDDTDNGSTSSVPIALEIELNEWKLADDRSPTINVNIGASEFSKAGLNFSVDEGDRGKCNLDPILLEKTLYRTRLIRSTKSVRTETIVKQLTRCLALDATPSFVLAAGRAVQGMLASGVADYVEFKTIDGLYWLEKAKPKGNTNARKESRNGRKKNDDDDNIILSRVPCSKNDVFGTKLLAPMEKRRFMKFIQLSMDYATKMSVAEEIQQENNDGGNAGDEGRLETQEEVHSLNERHLNQGRSLARPQNKAVDTGELQALEEVIENESMTFDDFLLQKYKLSPKLRSIVRYALAWEIDDASTTLAVGMATLRKHLQALGRYGTTAFLVPLYGSGELSQSFCRSAAVFGATYLLRRAPLAIQLESLHDSAVNERSCELKKNEKRVKGIFLSNDTVVNTHKNDTSQQQPPKSRTKHLRCSQVIVPVNAMDPKYFQSASRLRRRVVRRISVFSGNIILHDTEEQRHVVFIPPQTMGNHNTIHGVVLDNSVAIAPKGCTVLHLTTTIIEALDDEDTKETNVDAAEILKQAQANILKSNLATITEDIPIELYHVSFSHECPDFELGLGASRTSRHPNGIHFCSHTAQALTADAAFEQAEKIFSSICPEEKFLGLSSEIDKVIRERVEEKRYDDDEKNMLESAMGMIGNTSSEHRT